MIHQVSLESRLFHCDSSAIYRSVGREAGQLVKKKRESGGRTVGILWAAGACVTYVEP